MRRRLVLALVVLLAPPRAMADDALTALLERVAGEHAGAVQVVVGITTPEGRSVTAHPGTAGSAADGTALFEIGSLTKVFTGLLLADAVVHGEVAFETPVGDLLPDAASMGGEGPSLLDLATHTSGLPRLPPNLQPRALDNPYADYHEEDLLAVLPSLPRHDTPQPFVYSNLGSGLLGQALAWHAGTDYATLLQARVLKPLGLHETMVDVPPGLAQRRAPAHDATGRPTAYWDFSALAGAGALNASADDLLSLLDAYLDRRPSPLAEAMRQQLANRRAGNAGIAAAAVGWFVEELAGRTIAWHNGSTGGTRSFMGFDTTHGIGVVVLTNTTALDVTPLGLRLLRNGLPEAGSFPHDKEVTMLRSMLGGATLGAALAIANPAPVAAQPAATPTAQQASELDQAYRTAPKR
ncbi:serine hydrolase domain-containing protein [Coralloluteibacterium thermophilus]|uniref:Serine hydrolase domain-containing protein n=1 Tax=Coralloluteibacterium thermophilum TaxID=2707049 RepID=A0ABV9NQT2_9GAMM